MVVEISQLPGLYVGMICPSVWGIESSVLCLGTVKESCAHEEVMCHVPQHWDSAAPAQA